MEFNNEPRIIKQRGFPEISYITCSIPFIQFIQYSLKSLRVPRLLFFLTISICPQSYGIIVTSIGEGRERERYQRRARSNGPVMAGNLNISLVSLRKKIIIRSEVDSYIIFQYRTQGGRDAATSFLRSTSSRAVYSSLSFRCRLILMALSEIH